MKVQVIEKKKGRIDRTTEEIIKGNLRVCVYARVSTEVELTALENFISFGKKDKNKIKRVKNHKIKVTIEVDLVCGAVRFNIENVNSLATKIENI